MHCGGIGRYNSFLFDKIFYIGYMGSEVTSTLHNYAFFYRKATVKKPGKSLSSAMGIIGFIIDSGIIW